MSMETGFLANCPRLTTGWQLQTDRPRVRGTYCGDGLVCRGGSRVGRSARAFRTVLRRRPLIWCAGPSGLGAERRVY